MMTDTRVYALYVEDVGMVHNDDECAGDILYSDESHSYAIRSDDGVLSPAQAVYSIDDTEDRGMSCDHCAKYIFEPDYRAILERELEAIIDSKDGTWRKTSRIVDLFGLDDEKLAEVAQDTEAWENA